jgi:phosphatidylglycerol---prolipoprotein diacylglyceryl transferase
MFINNFNPIAFQFFSFEIRWYSLAYIFGITIGWIYCKKVLIKNDTVLKLFDDYITYLILGVILGGRLGYIIFYDLNYYFNNPVQIFMIWSGGMSFHGGLIGTIISNIIFANKHNQKNFTFLDLVSASAPIGIFLGRVANFINSELYGIETNVPWSVKFILIDNLNRHPSQLYEAFLEGIILFLILRFFIKKNYLDKPGLISSIFLIFYSIFRIIGEIFRNPDPQIGYLFLNLTMGQIISIIFLIVGLTLFYKKR